MTDAPRLILASSSPRRAEVLRLLGLPFDVRVPAIDEAAQVGEGPTELAERLARAKASKCAEPGAMAVGFDTLVAHRGAILGKPTSAREASQMVRRLSGDTHDVYTGISIATPSRVESAVETTRVRFREVEGLEREAYVATGEPLDKAGAYGIQGYGAALVEWIEGDYFNVMGFPIQRFQELLRRFGWRYDFGRISKWPQR